MKKMKRMYKIKNIIVETQQLDLCAMLALVKTWLNEMIKYY